MPGHPSLRSLPRPVAFVLSGGAALGALQVGQLQALMECGLAPDMLVGTSAGALNCAFVGQGWTPARLQDLARVWRDLRFHDVFGRAPVLGTLRLVVGASAMVSNRRLATMTRRWLPADQADLAVPTILVAADLLDGSPVPLASGDLRRNVLASSALPGVLPPVEVDGRLLVDGGIAENVPMLQAARAGAMSLVVLDASRPCRLETLPEGVIERTILVIHHTLASQVLGTLAMVPSDRTVLYLPGPCPLDVGPGRFDQADRLVRLGYETALPFLEHTEIGGPAIYGDPRARRRPG